MGGNTQHPPPAQTASVSEEKKKLPTQRRKSAKNAKFKISWGFFAAFAALRLGVENFFFELCSYHFQAKDGSSA